MRLLDLGGSHAVPRLEKTGLREPLEEAGRLVIGKRLNLHHLAVSEGDLYRYRSFKALDIFAELGGIDDFLTFFVVFGRAG